MISSAIEQYWKRRRCGAGVKVRVLVACSILLVLLFGAFLFTVKPAYRWVRERQADRWALEASAFIDEEDWKSAVPRLNKAYSKSPRSPVVLRVMAELYGYVDLKRQRQMLKLLLMSPKALPEDYRALVGLELRLGNLPEAQENLATLLEKFPATREDLDIAVEVSKTRKDWAQLEEYLRRIAEIDPEDEEILFELYGLQTGSTFEEKSRAAWERIYALTGGGDEVALKALRLIVSRDSVFPLRNEEIYGLMEAHPDATQDHIVSTLGWWHRQAVTSRERDAILERAIADRRGNPHHENRALFFWLNTLREHDKVLELLPKETAYSDPELLAVYLTALIQAERWEDLDRILEHEDELGRSSEVAFIKAQCVMHMKDRVADVMRYLEESYSLAMLDKRLAMLPHIATLAENRGHLDLADEIYRTMTTHSEMRSSGYSSMLRLAKRRKDLRTMRRICEELIDLVPSNTQVRKLAAYLDLLLGVNLETASVDVKKLIKELPRDEECKLMMAFAYFRMGDKAAAREVAQEVDYSKLTPSYRAIYAVIEGETGDVMRAVTIAEKIPVSLLLKEELDLIEPWLPMRRF